VSIFGAKLKRILAVAYRNRGKLWSARKSKHYVGATQPLSPADQKRFERRSFCYWLVDHYLEGKGLSLRAEDCENLARAVTREVQRVVQNHRAYLRGSREVHIAGWKPQKHRAPTAPITFESIIEGLRPRSRSRLSPSILRGESAAFPRRSPTNPRRRR
jgi:hypothetical protein